MSAPALNVEHEAWFHTITHTEDRLDPLSYFVLLCLNNSPSFKSLPREGLFAIPQIMGDYLGFGFSVNSTMIWFDPYGNFPGSLWMQTPYFIGYPIATLVQLERIRCKADLMFHLNLLSFSFVSDTFLRNYSKPMTGFELRLLSNIMIFLNHRLDSWSGKNVTIYRKELLKIQRMKSLLSYINEIH